jgi:hypothetical protein
MKTPLYFVIVVCFGMVSCTSTPKQESPVGNNTFALLQKMNTLSQDDFNAHFLTLEELREFAKDSTVKDIFRNAVTKVSTETHNRRLREAYQMIKESGERYKIDWNNIRFREYPFTLREESGVTFQDGFLAFDHGEKKFVTKIVSITYKDQQRLFNIANIEPVRKQ